MQIGMITDSLSSLQFDEVLKLTAEFGITTIEVPTGNWSEAPHCNLQKLLEDTNFRKEYVAKVKDYGLSIGALNANGNPLHPTDGERQSKVLTDTIKLAGMLNVPIVVTMSGLPAGNETDKTPNWVTTSWPPETQTMLDYQWNKVAIPYWKQIAKLAESNNVKIGIEMHPNQLVFNVKTMLQLNSAIGDTVAANLDPSHLMWQGADILEVIRALSDKIYHVHAKDTYINTSIAKINGLLDTAPPTESKNRSWNFVTLGLGEKGGVQFWGQFCAALRYAGFDGILSIEHEDVIIDAIEGVNRCVNILKAVTPIKQPSWKPANI